MENFRKLVESEGEKKLEVKDYLFAFGKHKGKSFEWVYDNDLKYVGWLMDNVDEEKNKHLVGYYKKRIEEDFNDDVVIDTAVKRELELNKIVVCDSSDGKEVSNDEVLQMVDMMRLDYAKKGYDVDKYLLGKKPLEECKKMDVE